MLDALAIGCRREGREQASAQIDVRFRPLRRGLRAIFDVLGEDLPALTRVVSARPALFRNKPLVGRAIGVAGERVAVVIFDADEAVGRVIFIPQPAARRRERPRLIAR